MMHDWCDVSLDINPITSFEKLGPRGMGICDTTANASDRYVQITAIPKESCLQE
jgi:hypothetical protein